VPRSEQHEPRALTRTIRRTTDKRASPRHASGLKTLQPIALFQVSMLRMWAHSIERFAGNYEKALDETRREASERAHL
jgi:hypothetical protein